MPLAMPLGVLVALLFGVMVWLLPALKVTAAVIGVAAVLTIIRRPLRGLLLFGVLATFLPYATVQIGIRTTVSEALLMLIWASLLAHRLFALHTAAVPLLRTERWLIALMLFSALPFVVGQLSVHVEGNGPINWVRWLFNLSPLFLVPRLLREAQAREQMVVAILFGTLLMLLLSIPVYLKEGNSTAIISVIGGLGYSNLDTLNQGLSGLSTRMGTPWTHPNIAGGAMAMLLPLAFCIGLTRQGVVRHLGLAVALLALAGLLLTGSRGALVSLVLVMGWMARRRVPHVGRLLIAGAIFGMLLLMFYPPLQERLIGLFSSNDASTAVRFEEYSHFPDALKMFPLGIGFKVDPPVPGTGLWGISNLWLNYAYKLGIPGMLVYIGVTVAWWREARLPDDRVTLNRDTALWLGSRVGVLAALLSGAFDHYFSFTTVLIALFWLLLGLNLYEARRLQTAAHALAPDARENP
ncbi:O-antigen ligase family protein [Pseudomonas sp. GD03842]|uniref:O-antigen ligase family protein n=1 Tax=Pseudomonas sp. GD03842 TaxID=2975385 RepID=UPI0024493744|nr:O-antigen ligase family protein [Pseudomonas sp. GD03842]MDH0748689.1 O-antigen ligase family protein [Pseudomonas sp. GD03842]